MGLVGDQIRAACVPYSVHSEYIGRSMHILVQSCGEGAPRGIVGAHAASGLASSPKWGGEVRHTGNA